MSFLRLPLFPELEGAQRVLLAGAGGGFDVFCGLPLYAALRGAGKTVYLSNMSFTNLSLAKGRLRTRALMEVTADTDGPAFYFPELYLARWFRSRGEEVPVYCFACTGVQALLEGYRFLARELNLDTVILVDGGTDSLMRGDECDLGTPHEDIASIAAVDELEVGRKLLVCLGFGIDYFHGVCHAQFLEGVAEVTRAGGFLGAFSLLDEMPEVQFYREASRAVFAAMPHHVSIVSSSILSALSGNYGNHHATERTAGSTLWINPLMTLYWGFRLRAVAQRILYLDAMKATWTKTDVFQVIAGFRMQCQAIRPWVSIPV